MGSPPLDTTGRPRRERPAAGPLGPAVPTVPGVAVRLWPLPGRHGLMQKTSARLLSLLSLLQARRDWPGGLLARRLDISPRTLRRDVDRLRQLGYPVVAVVGYETADTALDAGTRLPPLLFDDEQAVALAVALRTATPPARVSRTARHARRLPSGRSCARPSAPPHRRPPGHRRRAVHVQADGGVLMTPSAAVRAHEALRFGYASPYPAEKGEDAVPPPRRVQPHTTSSPTADAGGFRRLGPRPGRLARLPPTGSPRAPPPGPVSRPRELPGGDAAAFVTGRFRGSTTPRIGPAGVGGRPPPCSAATVSPHAPAGKPSRNSAPDRRRLTLGSWSWPALVRHRRRLRHRHRGHRPARARGGLRPPGPALRRRREEYTQRTACADGGRSTRPSSAVNGRRTVQPDAGFPAGRTMAPTSARKASSGSLPVSRPSRLRRAAASRSRGPSTRPP